MNQRMPVCRDCGEPASFLLRSFTNRGGTASTFHLCRKHAAAYDPRPASGGRPAIVEVPVTVRDLADALGRKPSDILRSLTTNSYMDIPLRAGRQRCLAAGAIA